MAAATTRSARLLRVRPLCSAPLLGAGILARIVIGIGLILLLVPGLYLITISAVLAPVIVLERADIFELVQSQP